MCKGIVFGLIVGGGLFLWLDSVGKAAGAW